jgi:hypothetical protein
VDAVSVKRTCSPRLEDEWIAADVNACDHDTLLEEFDVHLSRKHTAPGAQQVQIEGDLGA